MAVSSTFNDIFISYYNLYRGDGATPATTDPEWTIALRSANAAIDAWFGDPGFVWNELFDTVQTDGTGAVKTITGGTQTYAAPTNMLKAGGFIKLKNTTTNAYFNVSCVSPEQIQNTDPNILTAFFTGNPNSGYTLNFQGDLTNYNGWSIDYVYYKKPTTMVDGSSVPEMSDTSFMVHWMLAQRFRNSRNWPAYQTAMRDAQNSLKNMEAIQNSGTWFNSWQLQDSSGGGFGQQMPTTFAT